MYVYPIFSIFYSFSSFFPFSSFLISSVVFLIHTFCEYRLSVLWTLEDLLSMKGCVGVLSYLNVFYALLYPYFYQCAYAPSAAVCALNDLCSRSEVLPILIIDILFLFATTFFLPLLIYLINIRTGRAVVRPRDDGGPAFHEEDVDPRDSACVLRPPRGQWRPQVASGASVRCLH